MVDSGAILQSRCGDLIDDNVEGENEDDHDNDEVALNYTFKYNTCLTEWIEHSKVIILSIKKLPTFPKKRAYAFPFKANAAVTDVEPWTDNLIYMQKN